MRLRVFIIILFFLLFKWSYSSIHKDVPSYNLEIVSESMQDSLDWADYYYNIHRYKKAIPLYEKNLSNPKAEKTHILKKLALSEAALEHPEESASHLNDYLLLEYDPNFLFHEGFDPIRGSTKFKHIYEAIVPEINIWSIGYFVVAMIGFYVIAIILLNRRINHIAGLLISSFIFIHSLFILNISIIQARYQFEFPHALLMSTWASFLYGPLLYFYFKKIAFKYSFKPIDLLHLLPTLILLAYMMANLYIMSTDEKIELMLTRLKNGLTAHQSNKLMLIVILKIISLVVYGYFIRSVYLKSKSKKLMDSTSQTWQRNIYFIHILYVATYTTYGILIMNGYSSGMFYNLSIAAMALMVLYVGYSANIQPQVFTGSYTYINKIFPKYEKSGLTPSLSLELKENLLKLFENDKIYRENDISLGMVAQKLNTTRHNASQVINEHFNVSFHELVNTYRIDEAKKILKEENGPKLNIIDIAYEVGYNNKVTFNKAFKKNTHLTPTEYQRNAANM
ncbi:helix-turn-helix domain-containing protein [Allomuricauda sp. SCSIO 65647]|uniref:helix-turn-helix domain-containing protein n=1 Tax=Allomuricauda sp. SCSIO 65647 TaxID=2908843 RepID=UPI001F3B0F17|nr:helix-turn-helix domain-containing protein [Muricauda sp. SCSIO 65647]UJH66759.1 helix-turn-helix domain-containing protein [Muricauda sp. SCSIO 65647]